MTPERLEQIKAMVIRSNGPAPDFDIVFYGRQIIIELIEHYEGKPLLHRTGTGSAHFLGDA